MHGSLDTSVLVRLVLGEADERYTAAVALLNKFYSRFYIADVAFIEFWYVLQHHYGYSRQEILDTLDAVIAMTAIACDRNLMEAVLVRLHKHPKLSIEDCYLATRAQMHDQAPLWTFDKKLANQLPAAKLVS